MSVDRLSLILAGSLCCAVLAFARVLALPGGVSAWPSVPYWLQIGGALQLTYFCGLGIGRLMWKGSDK
ncbi:MAG: hypothetical protein ABIQ66_08845 [Novosphingobium sp.]